MKKLQNWLLASAFGLLAACGGGSTETPSATAPIPAPQSTASAPAAPVALASAPAVPAPVVPAALTAVAVSAVAAVQPLSYGKVGQISVTGSHLDQGITLTAPGCSPLTEQTGGSATSRTYSCQVSIANTLPVVVSGSAGASLMSASLSVPDPQVTLTTSLGVIVLELNPSSAPLSVNNFLKYTNDGFYDNLTFHRVISNFMIQGGGYGAGLSPKATTYAPIKLESSNGLTNVRGSLAMARTSAADSATAQFYINVVDNVFLNYASASAPGYAVFGKVVEGMSVVDAIRVVPTGVSAGMSDVPLTDVMILSARQTR